MLTTAPEVAGVCVLHKAQDSRIYPKAPEDNVRLQMKLQGLRVHGPQPQRRAQMLSRGTVT
eukprot:2226106-Karenia_brevis.AAC.1